MQKGKRKASSRSSVNLSGWKYKDHIVIADHYPDYDNLYAYAFVHTRVKAYISTGMSVDVFKVDYRAKENDISSYMFEGVRVVCGNLNALKEFLNSGRIKSLSIHFLNPRIWKAVYRKTITTPTYIWIHGVEVQAWYRRSFAYNEAQVRQAILSSQRNYKFWRAVFAYTDVNIHFIFVSQYLADVAMDDMDCKIDENRYSIVHNFIDTEHFKFENKSINKRTNILTLRPFPNSIYANDLTVKAILELSKKPFFDELSFTVAGDGVLFEELTDPIKNFSNVTLKRGFFTQAQIAKMHCNNGVFLCPTRMDSQGVSRDEAMASGLVPVTSKVAAVPEFVSSKEGYLAPLNDYHALAGAIEDLYKHPDKFSKMSAAAAARVRAQSGFEQSIKQEIELIESGRINQPIRHSKSVHVFNDPLSVREREVARQLYRTVDERERLKERLRQKTWELKTSESFRFGNAAIKSLKRLSKYRIVRKPLKLFRLMINQSRTKVINGSSLTYAEIRKSPSTKKFWLAQQPVKKLRMAAVLDEFTYESYKYEADILLVSPFEWLEQINEFKPDLLFIESAWEGNGGEWYHRINTCDSKLIELVEYCQSKNIPTVFWCKEDPPHFATFIRTAALFDFIFTSDAACIPLYRYILSHNRIFLLPFAAQPRKTNPIEEYDRLDRVSFAGAYYQRYKERGRNFKTITDTILERKGIDIYDRNYGLNGHTEHAYPEEYHPYIIGRLPFDQISKAYKGYRYAITMNSIKHSPTMFARRVIELLASNTITISNYSEAVRNFLGGLVICSDEASHIRKNFKAVTKNRRTENKYKLLGLRWVMSQHTYEERLSRILSKVFINYNESYRHINRILVIAVADNQAEAERAVNSFSRQGYTNKRMVIITEFEYRAASKAIEVINTKTSELGNYKIDESDYYAVFDPCYYYGQNYLIDLELATKYSSAKIIGKGAYFVKRGRGLAVVNEGTQYRSDVKLRPSRSIFSASVLAGNGIKGLLELAKLDAEFEVNTLAIDEFSLCDSYAIDKRQTDEVEGSLELESAKNLKEIYHEADKITTDKYSLLGTRLRRAMHIRKTLRIPKYE